MANDWGKPFTPEELAKLAAETAETVKPTLPAHIQQAGRAVRPTPKGDALIVDHAPKPETEFTRALETIMHPDFGKTIAFEHRQELVPQVTDPTPATLDSTPEELAAKGWVQTAHDEWEKIAPDTSPFAGAKVTLTYIDEAHIAPGGDWSGVPAAAWPEPTADNWPGPMGEAVRSAEEAEPLTTDEPEHPDCVEPYAERTAPVETFSEADGPWYVVYFGPVLYTVLAGPYDTQEAAAERIDRVWAQFEHDAAYDYTFPVRERSGLRATTVRTVFNLKGAYGKQ